MRRRLVVNESTVVRVPTNEGAAMSGITDRVLISLPIEDRRRSMGFYRDVFGFELIGEPAEDGVPEPLQFRLNDKTSLMLIPAGGFGWVQPGREVATTGVAECLLGLAVADEQQLIELVDRVRAAGGEIVAEPGEQPWGYSAVVTDLDGHAWQFGIAA
ncbi:VOC family protein [Stackebrandtia endophytica]|uniref:VOC family protein n=1 Tax=Stackebrandtia endophytica TaxID=1496996 RepID=UPI0036D35E17